MKYVTIARPCCSGPTERPLTAKETYRHYKARQPRTLLERAIRYAPPTHTPRTHAELLTYISNYPRG